MRARGPKSARSYAQPIRPGPDKIGVICARTIAQSCPVGARTTLMRNSDLLRSAETKLNSQSTEATNVSDGPLPVSSTRKLAFFLAKRTNNVSASLSISSRPMRSFPEESTNWLRSSKKSAGLLIRLLATPLRSYEGKRAGSLWVVVDSELSTSVLRLARESRRHSRPLL